MGFGRGIWALEWAFLFALCCIHQIGAQTEAGSTYTESVLLKQTTTVSPKVNIIQPMLTNPLITSSNPAHNGRVCSTWGNFHFKTFDGDIFFFPGLCNYVFASHCNAPYEDFNIQMRRAVVGNAPTVSQIVMKLEGVAVELAKDAVIINGNRVQLPYSQSGITIEKSSIYVKVASKMGILLLWNEDDSILLELNEKYANQTCGLCGDFNGLPTYNEFYSNNIKMTALQFGNMQKMDGPTEHCEDSTSTLTDNCTSDFDDICQKTLTSSAFAECNELVDVREYIVACQSDLCLSEKSENASCICDTFAEYSRQCSHAGGTPLNWRTSMLCSKKCPYNMEYQECSSPCADTCTNPERSQLCEEHCMDGCFCPPGTVFDDINNSGCIPQEQCSCVYNGYTYATGASFSEQCQSCTCHGGQWSCQDMSCPGTCSVEGGSHISTFDKKHYDHHGDCTYVLSKHCTDETFTILAELRKCGLTDTETCLNTVTLNINKGETLIEVKRDGAVFVNSIYTQLPISAANVTVFRPSSFFAIIQTNFGVHLEIQTIPIMQVFVRLDPVFKNQTCGLCGNFNNIQTDDFKAISGIIEGTATAFANTWKTQASCPNIQQSFENPCALSIENEKYAQHWCGLLTDSKGPFADCHNAVNPSVYHTNCMFDTCNCENSEDCLCAALSSYVRACAAKGILLPGWRDDVCSKYTTSCPETLSYSYTISSCQPTCRSLSEPDVTCSIKFVPVDGCTCVNGTYLDQSGKCVPAAECPCYFRGSPISLGEAVHENGLVCTCIQGRLNCIGSPNPTPVCESPMVYFNCRNTTAGTTGAECQKSCQTLDMQCYSTQCVSGCVCPAGLVLDGNGGCIPEQECPCIHNEAMYQPGEKLSVDCNTCVCKNRKWECTNDPCLGTCAVYGDGHYNTFDDKRFSFNGNCEYTLVQDHCGKSSTANGTFRVITENIPCGNTGTTCSKSIKVFLEGYELILGEEHFSVVKRGENHEVPYTVRYMGMYLVIETTSGLILMWDKKTSIFIKLSPDFKGQVCGLCGNYDGNGINDFTTRSQSVVENVLEFGNSWKVSSTCPDAYSIQEPCSTNPYRKSWSERQCSIINSNVFAACHSQVEPAQYYQACVTDACACDTGGDCDCFCTAVAAYAQACNEVGVCIAWRTPTICPLFCDYYNHQGECEWHYKPCGASCMKTCRNPSGKCLNDLPGLEGCYPNCPPDKPYFHEDQMKCVSLCDCYDTEEGKIYRRDECQLCECTSEGLKCKYDAKACHCVYEGKSYKYGETIYNTTDGIGWCFSATCDVNGTINRDILKCGLTTTPTLSFSTIQPKTTPPAKTTATPVTTASPVTTVCVRNLCRWSEWLDATKPESNEESGDYETFKNLRSKGYSVCQNPSSVQCRAKEQPDTEINNLNQTVICSQTEGLICNNKDQPSKQCINYEIRISCCSYVPCSETETTTLTTTVQITTTERTPFTILTKTKPTQNKQTTPGTSKLKTQTPPQTGSPLPQTSLKPQTTTAKTSPPPTPSTTIIPSSATVPTSATTTTSTSSTTVSISTAVPGQTTTVTTELSTSPTVTTPKLSTTTGTTVPSSTTESPTEKTTTTSSSSSSTSKTSPPPTPSTTIIPPTSAVPTPATTTTSTSSTTSRCQERCFWSQWFNVDSPAPGTENGDMETFAKIRAAGYNLCDKPRDIQCRAKDFPDRTIQTMGQVFECSLDTGLICRNKDQIRKYPMCFDYEITVYCCERDHCLNTTATTGTTGTGTPTSPTVTSTTPQPTVNTTTFVPSTTGSPAKGTTTSSTSTTRTSPPPTSSTTLNPSSATVPTSATTTTSSSSTTVSISTAVPGQTTTVPTGPSTSPTVTAATLSTTTGTTLPPSTTEIPTEGTTITTISTGTNKISPPPTQSTTIIPPTSAVPTPATTTTSTSSTTSRCQERCFWSQWFNVDSPAPGTENGDMETFAKIRAAGYNLCDKPRDIKCRAKDFPDRTIQTMGQVFECSLDTGLICRNKDQIRKYPMCFDYEITVYCCERDHCLNTATPGTTGTGTPTSPTVTSTTPQPAVNTTTFVPSTTESPAKGTTTSSTSTTRTSPPPTSSTTISPSSATVPTSATTTTSSSSTTVSISTAVPGQTTTVPTGPSTSPTVTTATLSTTTGTTLPPSTTEIPTEGTTTTTISTSTTRTSPPPTSSTTISPSTATVPTPGTTTTSTSSTTGESTTGSITSAVLGKTTTVLTGPSTSPTVTTASLSTTPGTTVPPSTTEPPTQGKTTAYSTGITSTTRTSPPPTPSTTISPSSATVPTSATTTTSTSSTMVSISTSGPGQTTTVPKEPSTSPTVTTALLSTTTGTTVHSSTTESPTKKTTATSSSTSTTKTSPPPTPSTTIIPSSATVPTSATTTTSSSSTTVSISTAVPGKTITVPTEPSTSPTVTTPKLSTSTGTKVSSSSTETPTQRTATTTSSTSTTKISPPSTSSTTIIPSTPAVPTSATTTTSTSSTSTKAGTAVSIPTTEGSTSVSKPPCFCHVFGRFLSPGDVVYNTTDKAGCNFYALCNNECETDTFQGPCPSTTFTPFVSKTSKQVTSSTERASSVSSTTATSPTTSVERNCTDVNPPRKPGENWISQCQNCICDPLTGTTQCQPLKCQTEQRSACDQGFLSMAVLPSKEPCCPEFRCRPIPDVCVINGTTHTVGMSTITDSCQKCTCSSEKDPMTMANVVHCEPVRCETSCPLGHQYMAEEGQCCGKCLPVACKIRLRNNTLHVLKVDEILPLDNCSYYKCEIIEDQYVAVQTKKVCPAYDPGECDPDEIEMTPDGCCEVCKPTKCKPYSQKTVIRHGDCQSAGPVELTYCEGNCPGASMYSLEANKMQHQCGCCQELSSQSREVTLTCQNGTSINYNYIYIEHCQCIDACASETSAEDYSQMKQTLQ